VQIIEKLLQRYEWAITLWIWAQVIGAIVIGVAVVVFTVSLLRDMRKADREHRW
jgi:multisubunit Na+/H+ antiporter MnhC subunit